MSCFTNPAACVAGFIADAGGKIASGAWEAVCKSFADAAASLLGEFAKAFVSIPPVDLTSDGVRSAYGVSLGIAGMVAGILILAQVIRTAVTHDGSPVAQAVVGLGKALLAFTLTLTIGATALRASDELTQWIVVRTFGSTQAMTDRIGKLVNWNTSVSATLLFVMAIIGILLTIVLWFEMLLRNAAIAVLVATSPIAAVGQMSEGTKHWWSRLVSATIQLIILKPVIALVFCLGLSMTGQANDVPTLLSGMLVLLLAAVAWPAIARFFTFASVHVGGGAGLGAVIGFAAGRGTAVNAAGPGMNPADFARMSEARTMSAVGARAGGSAMASGGAAAGAAAGGAKGAAAAFGPIGAAVVAGASVAQRAANSLTGRMEGMAGHAGIPGANPYAQPAGYAARHPWRSNSQPQKVSWPQAQQDSPAPSHDEASQAPERREALVPAGEPPTGGRPSREDNVGRGTQNADRAAAYQQPLPTGLFPGETSRGEAPLPAGPPAEHDGGPLPPPDPRQMPAAPPPSERRSAGANDASSLDSGIDGGADEPEPKDQQ